MERATTTWATVFNGFGEYIMTWYKKLEKPRPMRTAGDGTVCRRATAKSIVYIIDKNKNKITAKVPITLEPRMGQPLVPFCNRPYNMCIYGDIR